jgi:hypothetical protein
MTIGRSLEGVDVAEQTPEQLVDQARRMRERTIRMLDAVARDESMTITGTMTPEQIQFWADLVSGRPIRPPATRWQRLRGHVYLEPRDVWIGYYRGDRHHYVCLLPCVVIRWARR